MRFRRLHATIGLAALAVASGVLIRWGIAAARPETAAAGVTTAAPATSTSTPVAPPAAAKHDSKATDARRLQRAKEDRDDQIVQAKADLAKTGRALTLAIDRFRADVERHNRQWPAYCQATEQAAGSGMDDDQIDAMFPRVKEVDWASHASNIAEAKASFELALQSFDVRVKQIDVQYLQTLETLPQSEGKDVPANDMPKSAHDGQIEEARRTLKNLPAIVNEIHQLFEQGMDRTFTQ